MPTSQFEPRNPGFEGRVRASFARQGAMATIGASPVTVESGHVVIELPWSEHLTQQHGFLHAGIVATALDSACGYAAFSLMSDDAAVLTAEYKINLLAPAQGQRFRMAGHVLKAGRTISFVEGKAYALGEKGEKLVATMTATLVAVVGREGIQH